MNDLIYRQKAIEALKENRALYCDNTTESFRCLPYGEKCRVDEIDSCIAELVSLPSAEPESSEQPESAKEYCAECDHIEMCRWYPFEGCEFRSLPSAQPEIIRCKYCEISKIDMFGHVWCSRFVNHEVAPDGFCSWASRKEN